MSAYSSQILGDSPKLYLRLDETSGTVATDSSGNTLNGTYTGGFTLNQTGALSQDTDAAISLNGSTGAVTLANPALLQITGKITLEAWVKPAAFPSSGGFADIIEKGYDGTTEGYYLRIKNVSGVISLDCGSYNGTTSFGTSWDVSGAPWTVGQWAHVVATYDGTNWNLYFNAFRVAQTAGASGALATTANVAVGAAYISGSLARFFNGTIDEVAIYNTNLSQVQIENHYYQGSVQTKQLNYLARGLYAAFHFNMSTFENVQIASYTDSPNLFNPTNLNIDQWLNAVKSAGFKGVMLTAVHEDGFCLWPSTESTHNITLSVPWYANSGNLDFTLSFLTKARAKGLAVGLYYSVQDDYFEHVTPGPGFTPTQYINHTKARLLELLGGTYGTLDFIWTDAWGWSSTAGYSVIPYATIHNYILSLQPNIVHLENNHEGTIFHTDIVEYEQTDPPAGNVLGSEEIQTIFNGAIWFYNTGQTIRYTAAQVTAKQTALAALNSTFMLSFGPDTTGQLPAAQTAVLSAMAPSSGGSGAVGMDVMTGGLLLDLL